MRPRSLSVLFAVISSACAPAAAPPPPTATVAATPPAAPRTAEADIVAILGDGPRFGVPADDRPCRGAAEPLVTIVEFIDLHSPFVRRVEPVVARLLHDYSDGLRVCVRYFTVNRDNASAVPAAEAAEEAFAEGGSAAFFLAYHHLLAAPLTPESVEATIDAAHLDAPRFHAALGDHRHLPRIKADLEMAVATGHTGAPSFFIQGVPLGGARPYADFQKIVDDEIVRARLGVPRAQLFEVVRTHAQGKKAEERRARAGEPEVVWIRTIDIAYGGYGVSPPTRTKEEARKMLEALLARIRAGEDFAAVARERSEAATAPRGGDHGMLRRNSLTAAHEDAAFALPVGGVSEVVEGAHGFSIVMRYR